MSRGNPGIYLCRTAVIPLSITVKSWNVEVHLSMGDRNAYHRPVMAGIKIATKNRGSSVKNSEGTLTGVAIRLSDNNTVLVTNLHVVSPNGWAVSGGEPIYQIAVNNSDNVGRLLAGGWVPVRGRHISSPSFLFRQRGQEQRLYEVEEQ